MRLDDLEQPLDYLGMPIGHIEPLGRVGLDVEEQRGSLGPGLGLTRRGFDRPDVQLPRALAHGGKLVVAIVEHLVARPPPVPRKIGTSE